MYFLGFDSSTQSLKAEIIDTGLGQVVASASVNFGTDLPQYESPNGFLPSDSPLVCHSSPLMWLDALDLVCQRLKDEGAPLAKIQAISGSGQQHGSVYLTSDFPQVLSRLSEERSLAEQLAPVLSRRTSPIWMDRSTSEECAEMTAQFGDSLQAITGSPAIERFTGAQIRRFAKSEPENYRRTSFIHLVSSFMCSVISGKSAPIDYGDGAGMNLLDLRTLAWNPAIASFLAPDLLSRLPEVIPGATCLGTISPYFSRKYGFNPQAISVVWSGDNPCSLVGTATAAPGCAGISLGTSDTLFAGMREYRLDPGKCGHVMGNPAGGFMSLICFSNGSLAREKVRTDCQADWKFFDVDACQLTPPGNLGRLMLPYFAPESTPLRLTPGVKWNFSPEDAAPEVRIRAILESQALSVRLHTLWLGEKTTSIRLTGGAAKSPSIRQIYADVFQAPVEIIAIPNAAPLGAALLAAHGAAKIPFDELWGTFCRPVETIRPRREYAGIYESALEAFRRFEETTA